jgi:release factor glutamine methyltransferase
MRANTKRAGDGTGRTAGGAGGRGLGERRGGGGAAREKEAPTIIEAIRLAQRYLEDRGIESARLDAESLLAGSLGCGRLDLYLRFDELLPPPVLAGFREDLRKRGGRYPLQYILGEVEFYTRNFRIHEKVFIPRPETELLIEWICEIFPSGSDVRFIEFGLGAGVVSGSLAAERRRWKGVAFDASPAAVSLARSNFEALGVSDRLHAFAADGFDAVEPGRRFDLLAANPPYIPTGMIAELEAEVKEHEDISALDGGEDGLKFYPIIAEAGARLLVSGGLCALEIGDGQARSVEGILERFGFDRISMRRDYNGLERMVTAFKP